MPFDPVPIHVNLPAQENAILKFWDEIDAFEQLRAELRQAALVVSRRADHREQPHGRTSCVGPNL